ncbi:hypothetical protein [Pseudomonas turukhanskensis]|uniref:hypothetical protein n=1 Tax=Pseudomonas turukhanskensis TaxID=1806536 RepID=UPI0022F33284|nr:hypothetical protein [Pseudomonas turukhanskensis]
MNDQRGVSCIYGAADFTQSVGKGINARCKNAGTYKPLEGDDALTLNKHGGWNGQGLVVGEARRDGALPYFCW